MKMDDLTKKKKMHGYNKCITLTNMNSHLQNKCIYKIVCVCVFKAYEHWPHSVILYIHN